VRAVRASVTLTPNKRYGRNQLKPEKNGTFSRMKNMKHKGFVICVCLSYLLHIVCTIGSRDVEKG